MLHFSRASIISVTGITLLLCLMALPNVLPASLLRHVPSWISSSALHLGLDLRGGSLILLEIDMKAIISEHLDDLREEVRRSLRQKNIPVSHFAIDEESTSVLLTLARRSDASKALAQLKKMSQKSGLFGTQKSLVVQMYSQDDVNETTSANQSPSTKIMMTFSETQQKQWLSLAMSQSMEIIRRRVDEFGTTEPSIQKRGSNRILLQVPGLNDPERLKDLLGTTARLSIHLRAPDGKRRPPGTIALYTVADEDQTTPIFVYKRPVVTGDEISSARTSFDSGEPAVAFRLDPSGAQKFGKATRDHVGKQLAIVIDNAIISAPVVRQPILDGNGQISGGFTVEEAADLAITLRAGALPAPLHILEERTVGPSLGKASIDAGWKASVSALIGVVVVIFVIYGLFGIFASMTLLCNLVMLIGVLSFFGATLTLPGIAGIVLTIGMAVDANIIIFERIREEYAAGHKIIGAIDAGYRRAFWTIFDANLTTLLGAGVLYIFGTGLVRGFAITLGIGVLTSLFAAFFLTRMLIGAWVHYGSPRHLPL